MKLRRERERAAGIYSMSDLAFLLLIFIMLAALNGQRREAKIAYPEAEAAKISGAEKSLEIWIDRAGVLYLDGLSCGVQDIEDAAAKLCRTAPDTRLHIIADRDAAFSQVHKVLEILQFLEYRAVSLGVKDA
ncbi:MAG: biopolymer transporter ExbD [Treponema sp.]|jgi:biopolymer transport protein ExbD|nr:biopolymer transporter ExbD [Treponema sp.]